MASIFGKLLDSLSNISGLNPRPGQKVPDKPTFVGGNHNDQVNIFELFGHNVTESSHNEVMTAMFLQLFSLCPVIIIVVCQIGFALIQSGASRTESAATPFIANILTIVLSCLSYWAVGYTFSRSDGLSILGFKHWFSYEFEPQFSPDWLVHLCLAVTTANIATFGGLERCPVLVYCLLAPVVSSIIHSLAVHWSWHVDGWLLHQSPFHGIQYKDFGGSGVIHVVGGAAALTLSVVLGPRYGRIKDRKTKIIFNDLDGHSLPSEVLGGYLLVICFTCSNCLRVTSTCINCHAASDMARALINTLIAASSACLFTVMFVQLLKNVLVGFSFVLM